MGKVFSPEPELIADCACHLGEHPLWHTLEKRLYWCDIPNGRIFRFVSRVRAPSLASNGIGKRL
jgi:sugar lactone lactonase YvrE